MIGMTIACLVLVAGILTLTVLLPRAQGAIVLIILLMGVGVTIFGVVSIAKVASGEWPVV